MTPADGAVSPRRSLTVRAAVTEAAARFAFSDTPRLDAELLMAHALGVSREAMLLGRLDDRVPDGFAALVERRVAHEPVAYITGSRAFWTIDLAVSPGVLIPRADSETLIEAAVRHFEGTSGPRTILDLGTGPGTLLLAALDQWPEATGLGVDRSAEALALARDNASRLGLSSRARFVLGDWAAALDARFDLVLANPPYVRTGDPLPPEVRDYEPAAALFAGRDGLNGYHAIAPQLARLIEPPGMAAIEIGYDQAPEVTALLVEQGLTARVRRDLSGRDRCIVVTA